MDEEFQKRKRIMKRMKRINSILPFSMQIFVSEAGLVNNQHFPLIRFKTVDDRNEFVNNLVSTEKRWEDLKNEPHFAIKDTSELRKDVREKHRHRNPDYDPKKIGAEYFGNNFLIRDNIDKLRNAYIENSNSWDDFGFVEFLNNYANTEHEFGEHPNRYGGKRRNKTKKRKIGGKKKKRRTARK